MCYSNSGSKFWLCCPISLCIKISFCATTSPLEFLEAKSPGLSLRDI